MSNAVNIYELPKTSQKTNSRKTILDELEAVNLKKQIKLRAKKLANNTYSLYLHFRKDGKQEYEFLKLYLLNERGVKKKDKETLKLAIEIRDSKERKVFEDDYNFELRNQRKKANFVAYFKNIVDTAKASAKPWRNTYLYLNKFTGGQIPFSLVNEKFCEKFKAYLLENVSQNSTHTYFAKLKASLTLAVKDKIISANPAQFISVKKEEIQREFLTVEELKLLKNTPCVNEETKRAFLFTCFTGLRLSDVKKLTFDEVKGGYISFRQMKTGGVERIKLSVNAIEIIEAQKAEGRKTGRVFDLITDTNTSRHIRLWAEEAGIDKKITWHSGRHTFATLALTYGNDLYTVSKLLGHREIKTTQIYAKLIDSKKDEAIDKLPVI